MRLTARFDPSGIVSGVASARRRALLVTSQNVLSDDNRFVPVETGALRGSGRAEVRSDDHATVEWGTDADTARYARPQYYEPHNHATDANAAAGGMAADHWHERSAAVNRGRWARMYGDELARGTR